MKSLCIKIVTSVATFLTFSNPALASGQVYSTSFDVGPLNPVTNFRPFTIEHAMWEPTPSNPATSGEKDVKVSSDSGPATSGEREVKVSSDSGPATPGEKQIQTLLRGVIRVTDQCKTFDPFKQNKEASGYLKSTTALAAYEINGQIKHNNGSTMLVHITNLPDQKYADENSLAYYLMNTIYFVAKAIIPKGSLTFYNNDDIISGNKQYEFQLHDLIKISWTNWWKVKGYTYSVSAISQKPDFDLTLIPHKKFIFFRRDKYNAPVSNARTVINGDESSGYPVCFSTRESFNHSPQSDHIRRRH